MVGLRSIKLPRNVAGITSGLEFALRFARWASTTRGGPTVLSIQARFRVSRATAYRYLAAWRAAGWQPEAEGPQQRSAHAQEAAHAATH